MTVAATDGKACGSGRQEALSRLFSPRSLAIVGASDDPTKWGHWLSVGALRGARRRSVHLVNPHREYVLQQKTFARVSDIPDPVDLVVLAVPAARLLEAADDALRQGARALVAIATGFAESGAEGLRAERDLVENVRQHGAVLLGPNCLGLFDASAELYLTSNDLPPGPVALISQSGNLALELGALAEQEGIGIGRFVSVGNQADLDMADLLQPVADADGIRAVAVYGEDWRDGRRFLAEAERLAAQGIGVVLLTVGSGQAAVRAARSHTGALATDPLVMEAACRAAGIHLVRTPGEMVDRLQFLVCQRAPRGPRLAIVADGGGHGVLAAELAEQNGLSVPRLPDPTRTALAAIARGSTENPVDLAGAGESDVHNFVRILEHVGRDNGIDAVLLSGYFGGYHVYGPAMASAELAAASAMGAWARTTGKTLVVHS
ncbi:MAG: CoA-binding protein, partial [Clostridia bacterium]